MAPPWEWPTGETVTCSAPEDGHWGEHTCTEDCVRPRKLSGRTCISCQRDIGGGTLTSAWEDGDNSSAYVTCPHCGADNIMSGFGGDD
jgi:DNA-directed RNA polymerase subunit RPC12/RpoP